MPKRTGSEVRSGVAAAFVAVVWCGLRVCGRPLFRMIREGSGPQQSCALA
jgi:hypothetical protein